MDAASCRKTGAGTIAQLRQALAKTHSRLQALEQAPPVDALHQATRHKQALLLAGKLPISMEPVDLAAVSAECLALLRPLALERQITLQALPPAPVMVQADRTRVRQVLLNLLSNAIKYHHDGGRVWLDGLLPA